MNRERTHEELKKENEELRAVLVQVKKAYELLGDALKNCPEFSADNTETTVESAADIKKLLEKYSRL